MKTVDLARDLAGKGYEVRPLRRGEKGCLRAGWNKPGNEKWLKDWSAPNIGLALRDLAFIDFDIDDETWKERVYDWMDEADPERKAPYRCRSTSATRMGLLFHMKSGELTYMTTGNFEHGAVEFLGGCGRLCAAFGTHKSGADLEWEGPDGKLSSLPPVNELPEITQAQLEALRDKFRTDLEAHSTEISGPRDIRGYEKVWDLRWDTDLGVGTVEDIFDAHEARPGLNMTAWRPDSDSEAGVLMKSDVNDGPMLVDHAHCVIHFMPETEVERGHDDDGETIEAARGLLQPTDATAEALETQDEASYTAAEIEDRRRRYVWVSSEERFYWLDDLDTPPKSRLAMRIMLGLKASDFDSVARNWELVADSVTWDPSEGAASLVTRPSGRVELNTYQEPTFPPGGDPNEFFRFLEGFIPDTTEREILLDWMALKVQNPGERQFAVVLLGEQGSGKSLFGTIFGSLFASGYASRTSLHFLLDGRYDDALDRSLVCVVDETDQGSRRKRDENYRALREKVDPAAHEMKLNIKGKGVSRQKVFTTFLFCTNDPDALPLEGDQRRFCVLQTGVELSPVDAKALVDWKASGANLGALRRALKERQSTLNPYIAPMTEAKEQMGLANRTEVDDLADGFLEIVEECGGWYTTPQAKQFAVQQGLHDNNRVDVLMAKLRRATVAPFGRAKNKVRIAGGTPQPLRALRGSTSRSTFDAARTSMRRLQSYLDAPVVEESEK